MSSNGPAPTRLCLLAACSILAGGVAWFAGGPPATQAQSSIARLGIDTNVAGNGPRTRVGVDTPREPCTRVDQGQTFQMDVFVDEVPADRGIAGFQFEMSFSPSLVTVTASDFSQLLDQARRSDLLIPGDTSSSDGSYVPGVIDFGPEGIEPDGSSEIGPGILVRISLTGQSGVGFGNLTLLTPFMQGDDNQAIPIGTVLNARVAVNTDCPPDSDSDGVPDDTDNCPSWPNPSQTLPPWPVPADDPDCDGFTSVGENFVGTLPLTHCAANNGANNEDPDAWPPDADDDQDIDVGDLIKLFYGKILNPPAYNPRSDFDGDTDIDVADIIIGFYGRIFTSCV